MSNRPNGYFSKMSDQEMIAYFTGTHSGKSLQEVRKSDCGTLCSYPRTIFNWMKSYEIPTRDVRESRMTEGARRPSKRELEKMHLEDLSSRVQIAKKMGVKSLSTIQRWMKEYGILIQPFDSQLARKKIVDKLLNSVEKNPEQLTTTDFYRCKNRPKGVLRVLRWYERKHDCGSREARDLMLKDLYGIAREEVDKNAKLEEMVTMYLEDRNGR